MRCACMAEKASSKLIRRSLVPRLVSLMSGARSLGAGYSKGWIFLGLRCRYNHSERKNHTKFFAEPPPHWSTTISHRLTPSLHPLLQTNHPFLFVSHLPLSTESLSLYLSCLLHKGAELWVAAPPLPPNLNNSRFTKPTPLH